ncbi:MAG: matrixin family metalloprotease, partial [Pyrinomonadaceae bacterium]
MRSIATLLLLASLIVGQSVPSHAYTFQFNSAGTVQVKWPTRTINIALSSSLTAPQSHIKPGSDVVGAARRALAHWADAANLSFVIQQDSVAQTIGQDRISLITVAPENAGQFNNPTRPGRSRIFFDPNTGAVTEADLAINPNVARFDPFTGGLVGSSFSTDGTPGTYDLESTFAHEIGHMLGLEHSAVVGATMQPRQGFNGTYDLPAQTPRTLSEDDRAGIRALYNTQRGTGAIQGTVTYTNGPAVFGAHVWAEELSTGRVMAGNITPRTGAYRIENLFPGQYRVVTEYLNEPVSPTEIASSGNGAYTGLSTTSSAPFVVSETGASVGADATTSLPIVVNSSTPFLNPNFIGRNGQLSTVAVPLVPGERTSILIGGDNVFSATSVSTNSPFITVNSVQSQSFGTLQVLFVDVSVSGVAPQGDYDVRLSNGSEVAYISGGLTVDLPNGTTAASGNPIDDAQFFVAQHYRDFLNREPDAAGLGFWTNQITECGSDPACRDIRRVNVSAAFFLSIEFQQTGYLVYRIHKTAFGNLPGKPVPVTFQEFLPETQQIGRGVVVGATGWEGQLEAN